MKGALRGTKGQTEIFGLVIVVLLVSLLLLLVLSFVVSNRGSDARQTYTDDQISIHVIDSLLKTSIPQCRGVVFEDVLIDCYSVKRLSCTSLDNSGQMLDNSCKFVDEFIPFVFKRSLDAWGKGYELKVRDRQGLEGERTFGSPTDRCTLAENVYASQLVIPAIATTLILDMRICD